MCWVHSIDKKNPHISGKIQRFLARVLIFLLFHERREFEEFFDVTFKEMLSPMKQQQPSFDLRIDLSHRGVVVGPTQVSSLRLIRDPLPL